MPALVVAGLVVVVIWLACKREDVDSDKIEDNKKNLINDLSGAESPVTTTTNVGIATDQLGIIPKAVPRDGSTLYGMRTSKLQQYRPWQKPDIVR